MASDAKSFERSQWWDWKTDTEIRANLVMVEGKNRELCVVASERLKELGEVAEALAERVFAGNKNMTVLLEAELEKAMKQAREIRKQTEAGFGDGSQLDFQMGIVSGLRSAVALAQVGSGDAASA